MPWYNDLRPDVDDHKRDYALVFPELRKDRTSKKRILSNLLKLRAGLEAEIPAKRADKNLLVASWNIRELGHYTHRLPESFFYMAEILNRFDLIAIQEIKSNLEELFLLKRLLGSQWSYMINDITEGTEGNSERSAYLFNQRRVELSGLAGELVLWQDLTANSKVKQLKRTPYITGFNAGWKSFSLINIHLHPGDDREDIEYRKEEIDLLLKAFHHKIKNKRLWNENLIIVGDMNLYNGPDKDDPTIKIIESHGFREVESLKDIATNVSKSEVYDRLFFHVNDYFKIGKDERDMEIAGVFDPFKYVFRANEVKTYKSHMIEDYGGSKDLEIMENLEKYYHRYWKSRQLSDHIPIWCEVVIDSSDDFLKQKLDEI